MSRDTIYKLALSQVGTVEKDNNLTPYGEWFGFNGQPWCAIFCSWAYSQSGFPLEPVGWPKGFASVPLALDQWKRQITKEPKLMDLVIFDWNKDKNPDHVGLFIKWIDKAAGTFETIEGNTSTASNSNGGSVMHRQRNMAYVEAFISPLIQLV